mmetsp:Transcript_5732/g.9558  ORF Transcript_5732/g.9558 Transcript_5732/m.9558 type:complete len:340 (-) Transcript_5732:36-1055(-)
MGGSHSGKKARSSAALSYSAEWFKGKRFDEKQRLLFEAGLERKGKVYFDVDLFGREFEINASYKRTRWYPLSEKPRGQIDITHTKIRTRGSLRIIQDDDEDYCRPRKEGLAHGIKIRCFAAMICVESSSPSWRNASRIAPPDPAAEFGDEFSLQVLQNEEMDLLIATILDIEHTEVVTQLRNTIFEYVPQSWLLSAGRMQRRFAKAMFGFDVILHDSSAKGSSMGSSSKRTNPTVVPIIASENVLKVHVQRSAAAMDSDGFHPPSTIRASLAGESRNSSLRQDHATKHPAFASPSPSAPGQTEDLHFFSNTPEGRKRVLRVLCYLRRRPRTRNRGTANM